MTKKIKLEGLVRAAKRKDAASKKLVDQGQDYV